MHCNSERRIRESLYRLAHHRPCRETLTELLGREPQEELERLLEAAAEDPYAGKVEGTDAPLTAEQASWVAALLEACRRHDSGFTPPLEDELRVRFERAVRALV